VDKILALAGPQVAQTTAAASRIGKPQLREDRRRAPASQAPWPDSSPDAPAAARHCARHAALGHTLGSSCVVAGCPIGAAVPAKPDPGRRTQSGG